jgi:hypothetical protein
MNDIIALIHSTEDEPKKHGPYKPRQLKAAGISNRVTTRTGGLPWRCI